MRSLLIAVIAAFAFASTANSAATPPYKLDAKGKCHGSNGQFAKQTLCSAPAASPAATTSAAKHCKDPKTKKFVKCGTASAVPA